MATKNLAAIDLGTNNCRLRITDNHGYILYTDSATTKLGEGLIKNMEFTDDAIERGLKCLNKFAQTMKEYKVAEYRAITTASCRMAKNGKQFVQMVEELCGIKLEIVSAYEEALLNVRGAVLNAPKNCEFALVYDLGGGSTEITLAEIKNEPKILYTVSIPWGARNASEHFNLCEYDEQKAALLRDEIKKYTRDFLVNSEFLQYLPKCCCIATSSTALRLMCMTKKAETYDRYYADGLSAKTSDIDKQIEKIFKSSLLDLEQNIYIGENRAPIIVAACLIFQTIYKTLQIKDLISSLKNAQDAIIMDLIGKGVTKND